MLSIITANTWYDEVGSELIGGAYKEALFLNFKSLGYDWESYADFYNTFKYMFSYLGRVVFYATEDGIKLSCDPNIKNIFSSYGLSINNIFKNLCKCICGKCPIRKFSVILYIIGCDCVKHFNFDTKRKCFKCKIKISNKDDNYCSKCRPNFQLQFQNLNNELDNIYDNLSKDFYQQYPKMNFELNKWIFYGWFHGHAINFIINSSNWTIRIVRKVSNCSITITKYNKKNVCLHCQNKEFLSFIDKLSFNF